MFDNRRRSIPELWWTRHEIILARPPNDARHGRGLPPRVDRVRGQRRRPLTVTGAIVRKGDLRPGSECGRAGIRGS
jgi:hypothetical protein